MSKPENNNHEDLGFLKDYIQAARSQAPSDAEWNAAHRRARQRLLSRNAAAHRPLPFVAIIELLWRKPRLIGGGVSALAAVALVAAAILIYSPGTAVNAAELSTPGELRIMGPDGQVTGICPLEMTHVEADIAGPIARTLVMQTFRNDQDKPIEAVYVFPLPHQAAVDSMEITVGERRILGRMRPKPEAREIYEYARDTGQTAGLLEQERPNIFMQSVANIPPKSTVEVWISYCEVLPLAEGEYEFMFPMTVAPRFTPGDAAEAPPNDPLAQRNGRDITINLRIDGGAELADPQSISHSIAIDRESPTLVQATLKRDRTIANKDFIVRYRLKRQDIADAVLFHRDERGTFFTLMLQPPAPAQPAKPAARELVFVVDRSGSMNGWKIEAVRNAMRLCIETLEDIDSFNVLDFSDEAHALFETPQRATAENRAEAMRYIAALQSDGSTQMMKGLELALSGPRDPQQVRYVCLMSDGQIGNDFQLLEAIQRNAIEARFFAFGIGESPNRYLLETLAQLGNGDTVIVSRPEDAEAAVEAFRERVDAPVLGCISIDWNGAPVEEVYPYVIPDLFREKPVLIHGRLKDAAIPTRISLRGLTAAGPYVRQVEFAAPPDARHEALPSLWARAKVEMLMNQDLGGLQNQTVNPEVKKAIENLGIEYNIMTQFTSFIAAEEKVFEEMDKVRSEREAAEKAEQERIARERKESSTLLGIGGDDAEFLAGELSGESIVQYDVDTSSVIFLNRDSSEEEVNGPAGRGGAAAKPTIQRGAAFSIYDPSNGTSSQGDVWRMKGEPVQTSSPALPVPASTPAPISLPAFKDQIPAMRYDYGSFSDRYAGQPIQQQRRLNVNNGSAGRGGAPTITDGPDVWIADESENAPRNSTDLNFFRSTEVFNIMDYVGDADVGKFAFTFDEIPPASKPQDENQQAVERFMASFERPEGAAPLTAEEKLGGLKDIAQRVTAEGQNGAWTDGILAVQDNTLKIAVVLAGPLSDELKEALKKAGLQIDDEDKAVRTIGKWTLVIGTIDVGQLDALARIEEVVRVLPVTE